MSTKNVILGACAACLAVGSAFASILNVISYQARNASGTRVDLPISVSPCPNGTASNCFVKVKTAGGGTLSGFAQATLITTGGTVITSANATIHPVTLD